MHYKISFYTDRFAVCRSSSNCVASSRLLDCLDSVPGPHVYSCRVERFHEPPDKIAIELGKKARAALQDRDLRSRARSDVRELRSDVAPTHQDYAGGQFVKLQKPLIVDKVLFPRKPERRRTGASCD